MRNFAAAAALAATALLATALLAGGCRAETACPAIGQAAVAYVRQPLPPTAG